MSFKVKNKATYTADGIPYMWNSGNVTTAPSNEVKITASDGALSDFFGWSVAVGSGRIVASAPLDDGVGTDSGSVYISDLNGNYITKLTASDGVGGDEFGFSVAVGSGRIIVGAYLSDNAPFTNSGSVYIFDLDGNQLDKITASDIGFGDEFGWSVAVGSGRIVVGSDDESVYIFDLDGNELRKITASDGAAGDNFGWSVAVGSGRIVVGARYDDVNGRTNSGSAYIFDLDGNELSKITASDGADGDFFGQSVAVGSGRIVVGAPQNDDGTDSGSAYIFDLDGNALRKISGDVANGNFGFSVAVGSGRIVVGAWAEEVRAGSVYIFDLDGNELDKITASDRVGGDGYGYAVAVGSGRIVVGAYGVDGGVGAGFRDYGSAYIYETPQVYNLYDAVELKGQT